MSLIYEGQGYMYVSFNGIDNQPGDADYTTRPLASMWSSHLEGGKYSGRKMILLARAYNETHGSAMPKQLRFRGPF